MPKRYYKMLTIRLFYGILILIVVDSCNSARILGLFPFPGRSHYMALNVLMKELTYRGHTVDVISNFRQETKIERYNDLNFTGIPQSLQLNISTIQSFGIHSGIKHLTQNIGSKVCDALFNSKIIKDLLSNRVKYDLMITHILSSDCPLIVGYILKVPVVGVVTSPVLTWATDRFGYPDNPSYISTLAVSHVERLMTLRQRFWNVFLYVFYKFCYDLYANNYAQKLLNEMLGEKAPSIHHLQNNMSLLLVNTHFSLYGARPTPPNVIEISGIHIQPKPSDSLPKPLEKLLNESKNGVIYFCLGSIVHPHSFSTEKLTALMETFRQLPYTIIWKDDQSLYNNFSIPNNIFFLKWTPQQQLLCHPNVKLFISHGGAFGTQEAIYCGVPIIGIPLIYDQHSNAFTYQRLGFAKVILYDELTGPHLMGTINEVLNDPSFQKNAKFISKLFQDRPLSAMDTAVYWIEYVIRYKGAHHLRPISVELSWYQYYSVDVALVVIGVVFFILFLGYLVICCLAKRFLKVFQKVKID